MSDESMDPVDELRYALWGDQDAGTKAVADRITAEGDDGPTLRRCLDHRRLRDAIARVARAEAPAELKRWVRRTVATRSPSPPPEVDVQWAAAFTMVASAGMRGGMGDRLVTCAFRNGQLQAEVHVEEGRAACAVTGRVLGHDDKPAASRSIAFFVDRRLAETATTDERGEFAFEPRRGSAFGVRIGEGTDAVHIALIDLAADQDGTGVAR